VSYDLVPQQGPRGSLLQLAEPPGNKVHRLEIKFMELTAQHISKTGNGLTGIMQGRFLAGALHKVWKGKYPHQFEDLFY